MLYSRAIMDSSGIARACKQLGGVGALARKLGVVPSAVTQWRSGDRPIPIERCVDIERVTGRAVTRKDLRPADWHRIWPELPGAARRLLAERKAAAKETA